MIRLCNTRRRLANTLVLGEALCWLDEISVRVGKAHRAQYGGQPLRAEDSFQQTAGKKPVSAAVQPQGSEV